MNLVDTIYGWAIAIAVIAVVAAVIISPIVALYRFWKSRHGFDKKTITIVVLIFFVVVPLLAIILAQYL